jgi:imidazolonepropionase-like amidohydrolase
MVRVMTRDTDAGLAEVVRMASLTPAERTGFAHDRGSLEPGKLADIVVLSRDLFVQRVFIQGVEFVRQGLAQQGLVSDVSLAASSSQALHLDQHAGPFRGE